MSKDFFCSPPYERTRTIANQQKRSIDEPLCDPFLNEKLNKTSQF